MNRTTRILLVLVLASLFLGAGKLSPVLATPSGAGKTRGQSAQASPEDKIDPALLSQVEKAGQADFFVWMAEKADLSPAASLPDKESKGAFVFEALRTTAEASQKGLRAALDAQNVVYRPFYIANKVLVRAGTESLLFDLASRPDVARITANHAVRIEEPQINPRQLDIPDAVEGNISFVNADDVWSLGFTGQGTVMAAIDTGLAWQHPAIINQYRGWNGVAADHNYNWWDPTGTYPNAPGDGFGHGTHVTGTMVGDDGGTNQIGMAPGAKTVHCKGLDDFGGGDEFTLSTCFEFFLAPWDLTGSNPNPSMAPDAINNSWRYWGGGFPAFQDEIAALQAAGVLVEVSAGNEGPSCQTLGSPSDYGEVTTTGSVSWASGSLPGSISWFSSRGPSTLSPEFIPDVMAPGENVRSAVPGNGYQAWDGTSMAGPHVTGLVGLLWAANPGLRGLIAETNQIIQLTSVPLTGQLGSNCGGDYDQGPNFDWGFGTIDALAAVQAALLFGGPGTLAGTVTDSVTSDPLENVLLKAALTPDLVWQTTTDAAGQYTRVVFSGTYTVSAGLYGYFPQQISGVSVQEGVTTTLDIQMDAAPSYLVSGTVTDALTGWPLYARVDILGYPFGPVFTDPLTGDYSVSLAAGQPYTFRVTPFVAGYVTAFRMVAPLSGPQTEDFGLNADLLACQAPGYVPEFVYFEDFETGDGGYSVSGSSSWEWGAPTSGPRSANSGANVWATNLSGDYFDNEFGMLTSPNIDMSAYSGQTILLSWWQWLETERFYDYAWVEVSNDGGSSWSPVYGPIDGSVSTTWTKITLPLDSSYAVSGFRVRFVLQSDFVITMEGFYVDDVGVGVAVLPPNLYAEDFEANDGGFSVSGTTSWAWGTPTRGPSGAHSGLNAWATNLNDNYGANEDGWITSPAIDLSGGSGQPMLLSWWQWLQTENGFDYASVEISDDGVNWTQVFYASGVVTTDWVKWFVELDPSNATSTFYVRFGLQSDGSVTYPGFYVDDLSVDIFSTTPPAVPCDPQSGGLVVGNVFDENTALPLNGATVASSQMSALSQATPVDPAVEDGFYTVFSLAGTQPVTATLATYGQDVQSPNVVTGGAVWQDFSLAAGLLAPNPGAVSITLDMGDTGSSSFNLDNQGNADATFQLKEKAGDFTPALALAPVQVPAYEPTEANSGGDTYLQFAGYTPTARGPMTYQVPPQARLSGVSADVLLLAAADVTGIRSILQGYPDLAVVDVFDARGAVPTLADLLPYDAVVVISNNTFADPAATGDALADYVDAGGKVVQTVPTFYDPPGIGWGLQGRFVTDGYSPFIGIGDWFSWADLGSFDASHPIMAGVSYAGDYLRQVVNLAPGADWVADWSDDEFIGVTDDVVALNTFLADGWGWDGDIPLIVHNSIIWLQTAGDVPWFSTDPITGTVGAQSTVGITVNFDAGVPEIVQPGDYTAAVRIVDDTPYKAPELLVTMTVNPPAGWGKLAGTVDGLGYCDGAGNPLEGADVDIQGVATTQTGIGGLYGYWMAAGSYTMTVSAPGYIPQSMPVSVQDGQTTTQDFTLRLDSPCLNVDPGAINLILDPGATAAESLSLDNSGAGNLNFTVLESQYQASTVSAPVLPAVRAADSGFVPAASGPASVLPLKGQSDPYGGQGELPLSGWFGAFDHPEGLIRYAYAQCYEQPESYYVFGGVSGFYELTESAWRYDAAGNTWTQLADMPGRGEAPTATCYQGKIYVMGGSGSSDMFIYSIAGDSWSLGASLPRGVEGAAAAAWNGKVFLVGGDDDFSPWSGVSDEVNIYDIAANAWIGNGTPLPVATGNAGFAQHGPHLYVVGGWGLTAPDANTNATQRYDLENDTWELGPDFYSARADFALAATAEALYALGGDQDGNFLFEAVKTTERLDLAAWPAGDWQDMSDPLPVALQANQAGACTQALFDAATPEIWSIGGLDTFWFIITGRTMFQERSGESCFSIYTDVDWLSVDLPAGSVAGDSSAVLQVLVDTAGLPLGLHTASIVLVTNDPGAPAVVVPVTVMVGQPYQLYFPFVGR